MKIVRHEDPRAVSIRLECGHTVTASEEDGGWDEIFPARPTYRELEEQLRLKVRLHQYRAGHLRGYTQEVKQ